MWHQVCGVAESATSTKPVSRFGAVAQTGSVIVAAPRRFGVTYTPAVVDTGAAGGRSVWAACEAVSYDTAPAAANRPIATVAGTIVFLLANSTVRVLPVRSVVTYTEELGAGVTRAADRPRCGRSSVLIRTSAGGLVRQHFSFGLVIGHRRGPVELIGCVRGATEPDQQFAAHTGQ